MIGSIKFVKADANTNSVYDDKHAQSLLNALRYTFKVSYICPKMFNIIALNKTLFIYLKNSMQKTKSSRTS